MGRAQGAEKCPPCQTCPRASEAAGLQGLSGQAPVWKQRISVPIPMLTVPDPHLPGETGDSSAETNWHRKMYQSLAWLWAECLFLRLPRVMTLVLK